ncbi:DUF4394 domain-containing protein [Hymenobacter sp. UV11]|uniref:DUF4394 domain-containing protein n=1 Tax=Hymenobacter sp. UV11 TaxID=1849735 RepID=UPI00105EA59D|nr:DUF4394 domain-containing protein [Hymenobacter sp. UV11]TDN39804.1 hypothetical protein A8B98_17705 [Hymenobacter sp. UV11]TFZ67073.1 DUF4394 domain-containing protein [Hymenobacter sp. UV11]
MQRFTRIVTVAVLFAALVAARPAAAQLVYGLEAYADNPKLVSFSATSSSIIRSRMPITGLATNQECVGLDFRPATGELFALGYDFSNQTGQMYTLNLTTAVATPRGSRALALPLGSHQVWIQTQSYTEIGFDFDPVADRIRVTSGITQANLTLDPVSGSISAVDAPLAYALGDVNAGSAPNIATVAYANSRGSTTAYVLDEAQNRLATLQPAASGQLHTIAQTNRSIREFFYKYSMADLDIYTASATSPGVGYFSVSGLDPADFYSRFGTIDLATGQITLLDGRIGHDPTLPSSPLNDGAWVTDIAVQPAAFALFAHPAELLTNLTLFPNPIVSTTQLQCELPRAAHVELTVTDMLGRIIDHVYAGQLPAGSQVISWKRKGQAAGSYFFHLRFDGQPAGSCRGILVQ